ncbi:hypothetical protein A1O3_02252 [Capronia epimyces CBS 606.96]|uniref:AMP-activated protein kinase glycogen-binding domain-containing protein n=1 Tax=Capronia epimyces CBS 606.96 TaxID=1182542 RepID=W9Y8K3_9EURO|nr:uncharacterized protein A1O3_02252 [Capronia epimyces CBS 606.96]EXJ89187.1 hypothetical protein A1O3_02252 [Capronia epimyces CBS 606.96]
MVAATITFDQAGIQPPVYVAGVFTDWSPKQMNHETIEKDGALESHFSYTFDLEPGEYQYKFRLGPGDWWVLDESTPTVNDGAGNLNNLLTVKPEETGLPAEAPAGREPEVSVTPGSAGDTQISNLSEADESTVVPPEHEPPTSAVPVTPETIVENFDAAKEDTIPDVAPPPYEEHHAVPASSPPQAAPSALDTSNEKISAVSVPGNVQSELKKTSQSWYAQNPVLLAAIVVVPVIVSYIWYR